MSVFDAVRGVPSADAAQMLGIDVKMRGGRGWALCPLHGERGHASMCFYPGSGGWYCYGCHAGGDAVKLYELYLGVEPLEAARTLAKDYGIQVDDDGGDALYVNVRHLETALERKHRERAKEIAEAYLTADDCVNMLARRLGEDAFDDPAFSAALAERGRMQAALDEINGATTEQLLEWFAEEGETNEPTGSAGEQPGGAGAGHRRGGAAENSADDAGGADGSAEQRGGD